MGVGCTDVFSLSSCGRWAARVARVAQAGLPVSASQSWGQGCVGPGSPCLAFGQGGLRSAMDHGLGLRLLAYGSVGIVTASCECIGLSAGQAWCRCQRLTGRGLLAWEFGPVAQAAYGQANTHRLFKGRDRVEPAGGNTSPPLHPWRGGRGELRSPRGTAMPVPLPMGCVGRRVWGGRPQGAYVPGGAPTRQQGWSQRGVAGKRPSPRWSRRTRTDHRLCSPERSGPEPSARRDARRTTILLPVIPPIPRGALLAVCSSFPPPGFPDCDLRSPAPAWRRTGSDAGGVGARTLRSALTSLGRTHRPQQDDPVNKMADSRMRKSG